MSGLMKNGCSLLLEGFSLRWSVLVLGEDEVCLGVWNG